MKKLAAVLLLLAPTASAAEPDTTLALTGRFGSMAQAASLGTTSLVPAGGVGLEGVYRRHVGLSLHYDFSTSWRGTSAVGVRRTTQQLLATVDARLPLVETIALRAGVGGGGTWLLATTAVPSTYDTAGSLEGGFAWIGSLEVGIPQTRFGFSAGATGLLHAASHDVLVYAGGSFTF